MKKMNILSSTLAFMLMMTMSVFAQSNGLSSTASSVGDSASGLSSRSTGSTATATGISNFTPETTQLTKRAEGIEPSPDTESTGSTVIIGRCNDPDYLRDRKRGLNQGSRLTCTPKK